MSPARWLRCEPDQFGAERDDQQIRMVAGPRNRPIEIASVHLPSKTRNFFGDFQAPSRVRAVESSGFMERAMGIEINAAWIFKDLRSRARTDLEGLGSVRNPYCRLDVALLP